MHVSFPHLIPSTHRAGVLRTVELGSVTIGGPEDLISGRGKGIYARMPIFLPTNNPNEVGWF